MTRRLASHEKLGFSICALLFFAVLSSCHQEFEGQTWTKDFAVEAKTDDAAVELAARAHGFKLVRKAKIGDLKVLHFHHPDACGTKHRCKRHAADLVSLLKKVEGVTRVEQQFLLNRDKRFMGDDEDTFNMDGRMALNRDDQIIEMEKEDASYQKKVLARHHKLKFDFNDPLFKKQWHLDNFGQITNPGLDLNLNPAWRKSYMGQNINVVVVDDGIDTRHKDLQPNYVARLSADLNNPMDLTGNPGAKGKVTPESEGHGTSCAGEIAAVAHNGVCGVGVAPHVRLGGVRVLAGHVTDLLEAFAVLHQHVRVHVLSNSWGPTDNGKKLEMPHYYTAKAIKVTATQGRHGLGTIINFASGNGGHHNDNCGADGYTNTPHVQSIGAINAYGRSVSYGERCAAMFAVTPVGGWSARDANLDIDGREKPARILTTEINGKCNKNFLGTSAATPLAAGCSALVVQANPKLTWRDVQHVFSRTCRIPNDAEIVWQRNGAGLHVSPRFGFGLMDCSRAVKLAQKWKNVGPRLDCEISMFNGKQTIYAGRSRRYRVHHNGKRGSGSCKKLRFVEHATVAVDLGHKRRGDLELWLTSPAGTESRLLATRRRDDLDDGIDFTFLTRMSLGEVARGNWMFEIRDKGTHKTKGKRGTVKQLTLKLYGTQHPAPDLQNRKAKKAYKMSAKEVRETFVKEREESLKALPEHRETTEIKRALQEGREVANIGERLRRMAAEPFVTRKEIWEVLEMAKSKL